MFNLFYVLWYVWLKLLVSIVKYAFLLAKNDAMGNELTITPYVLWFTAKGGSVFYSDE
ncbi:hypothetical protein [Proteus sp. TJ1640]|uniref:hypothetical protein n=1 Tax=Proteus sp. TJ1640 TaxID=2050968 RepID=UPI00194F6FE1|nr:hypothetical protein [Proteus sp. TJ1640]